MTANRFTPIPPGVPTTLPAGLYYALTRDGAIRYAVRFMLDGVRLNLGTFDTAEQAINAKFDFQFKDLERQKAWALQAVGAAYKQASSAIAEVSAELTVAQQEEADKVQELLESVPPHELSFDQSATIGGVEISAKVVTAFLNKRFGIES